MKYLIYILIFTTSLFATIQKEILLLHSYNSGLKWSDNITSGVKSIVDKYPQYELTIEYMDSKKINTNEYFENLSSLYEKKFSNRKYEVVITADNYAFEFVLNNHRKIFNSSPIVFCGVENFKDKMIPNELKKSVTGVIEYKEIEKNVELINRTIKDLDTLYIISDNNLSSQVIQNQILEAKKKFEGKFNIVYDNQVNIDTILDKINSLPQNSAILFTSLYTDIKDRYIPYNEIRNLFRNSKYPVFALNKIHLGEGIVGGIVVDPYEQGYLAAVKAFQIIMAKEPQKIEIDQPSSKYYFDYEILKKFDLLHNNVPLLSTMINEPKGFFEKYRKIIDSAFLMMPLLILLIIGLIVNITRRIKLEIKLVEQSQLDNVLLNNIKSAIYWKSNEDKILGCNDSLCNFLDIPKENLIGKSIKQVFPQICNIIDDSDGFKGEIETQLKVRDRSLNVLIKRKKYLNNRNQEAGIVTIISDITELKRLENQKKKNEQFIIQRSKQSEIGEMMTSIAHQWKAPLIEISTIAQELLYKRSKKMLSKEDSHEFVDEIMTQVGYMTKTIDDFRDFIRPSLKKSEFEVNSAMSELLRVVEHNIKYNYIKVNVNYENDNTFKIYGYPNEFKQCILSVINNCRDAILKRKKTEAIEGKIDIDVYKNHGQTFINIQDNGIGIKDSDLDKIFDPFFTSKKDGDGFGLYMVKLIIEDKMNGKIRAKKCNEGANIIISLENKVGVKNEDFIT